MNRATALTRRRWLRAAAGSLLGVGASPALLGCGPSRPPRLALVAGLTGPTSDIGVALRNGALLAVAQSNPAVELVEFDDRQQPDQAAELADAVQAAGCVAVIGPATSSMAAGWIPQAERRKLLSVSPTVTSHDFAGQDDHFFRICSTTRQYARHSALHAVRRHGWRRFALVRDDSNHAYTRSWSEHFIAAVRGEGAVVVAETAYGPGTPHDGAEQALAAALASGPETLVIVANARDTALLAQAITHHPKRPALIAAEWAATDQLILGGGRAVEGVLVTQFFDRDSQAPAYLAFAQAFQTRFGRMPGFAETAAYDATRIVLQALAERRRDEPLKATLLRLRRFDGVQNAIVFDDYGDCDRPLYVTEVRQQRFMTVPA